MNPGNFADLAFLSRLPSLTGLPHRILDVPVWQPPGIAGKLPFYAWTDGHWHMEMANTTPHDPSRPADRQPSGILRYRDLDVLLGLVHYWISQGASRDGMVTCSLADTLRWIGYGNSLSSAPYAELNACIQRLRYCRVAAYRSDEKEFLIEDRDRFDCTLLADVSSSRSARIGGEKQISARLSQGVIEWMLDGTQAIDLDIYAHLVRHPATRRRPLARVVWVALSRFRQRDGSIRLRPGWLASRYGDRRGQTKDAQGRLIYRDAFAAKSSLNGALMGLAKAGVLGLKTTTDGWLEGRFSAPENLLRLRESPAQSRLFHLDTMAIAEAAARGEPEPQPQLLDHGNVHLVDTEQRHPAKILPTLQRFCHVATSAIETARQRGFDDLAIARVLLTALYGKNLGKIKSPAAWAASRLREDDAQAWSSDAIHEQIDVIAARNWANKPGGPLSSTPAPGNVTSVTDT